MVSMVKLTGGAALGAGVLIIAGVEGEWLVDPQLDDGTVTDVPALALLMAAATVGFALLLTAVRGLRAVMPRPTRSARAGAAVTTVGAGLMVVFGLLVLVPLLVTGTVLEVSFLAFLLGMLLLSIGAVTWGLSLRGRSAARGAWQLLLLSGAAAFCALAIEPDPWHDVALVVTFGSWSVLGALLLRPSDRNRSTHRGAHAERRAPA
jgi:hypothetical protein